MTADTPRKAYDRAVARLVDAIEAGARRAAVTALGDAQALEPAGVRTEATDWVESERARVADLVDDLDDEPRGWVR